MSESPVTVPTISITGPIVIPCGSQGRERENIPDPMTPEQAGRYIIKLYDGVEVISGDSYKDRSTVIIVPTRGTIPARVAHAWLNLIAPMNQKRVFLFAKGMEVGDAYNRTIAAILADPNLSKFKYVMTMEDDNLPPADAHIRLCESIELGYDGVSGIYFTKGAGRYPMAYGDPAKFKETGQLDFMPRDWKQAFLENHLVPVNGIAMGCSLYRMDLFREIPSPWFVTVNDIVDVRKPDGGQSRGPSAYTQDLSFCENATRMGKTFAVDFRVKVGHLDVSTGIVY